MSTESIAVQQQPVQRRKRKLQLAPYFFVLPNLLIFTIFIVVPTILGAVYSLHDYDGLNPMKYIGFENYVEIFSDDAFWLTLGKTATYAVIVVPLIYACALGIAILLVQQIVLKGFFRAIFYWPTMISFIIVGLTWRWIFGELGIINAILQFLDKNTVGFLSDAFYSKAIVIIAAVWSRLGFFMVIFVAGLLAIPRDYYEAAHLDGASKLKAFFHITMPLLKPTTLLVVMLCTIEAFKAYPLMFALTGGGPNKATTYIVQYIYETGFAKQELGLASAMSVVLFIIITIFTVLQFKLSKGGENA
ncbi:carbohydrate ABC transporter permease [Paenibacillus sp. FSL W7-1287]|uniref:carbohydrate ABC transporter permease n=1 Tax=Paenibacillus sp. FSL W7-1287 TaxID=2954538 RepID=UPI0030F55717